MLSLALLALLSADPAAAPPEPMVVVVPFEVIAPTSAMKSLGHSLQSVLETDLKAAGVPVRTDDDLDSSHWGQIKGATHVLVGSAIVMGKSITLNARLIELPQVVVGTGRVPGLADRTDLVKMVLLALKRPAAVPALLPVDRELALAWGDALETLKDGEPTAARNKVEAVAKKWPAFTPATERLKQLGASR